MAPFATFLVFQAERNIILLKLKNCVFSVRIMIEVGKNSKMPDVLLIGLGVLRGNKYEFYSWRVSKSARR